ncbi:NAD(P)-binding domain-containing protein [bacterium]|nr:NAD(P)-binding domain-containing protein [bacterium]NUN44948.1 NAD(P)-binding domain-containing protein [bacterium]
MKIGVLGSGQVAQVLASGFIKHGHEVMMGTRDVNKLSDWKSKNGDKAQVGSMASAASFGELIVLAVKGHAAADAVKSAGINNLKNKTVIDVNNPIKEVPPVNGVLQFFTGPNESLMEQLQVLAPEANFVKAFSCVGNALMVNPKMAEGTPTMFICGNNDAAKAQVTSILTQFGWDWADMGKVEAARAIEPLCILWCIPGFTSNSWMHAFKLLKK